MLSRILEAVETKKIFPVQQEGGTKGDKASPSSFAKLLLCAAPLVHAALDSKDKRQNPAVLCETKAKWHAARLDESMGRCRCRGSATTNVIYGGTGSSVAAALGRAAVIYFCLQRKHFSAPMPSLACGEGYFIIPGRDVTWLR